MRMFILSRLAGNLRLALCFALFGAIFDALTIHAQAQDYAPIQQAMQANGTLQPDGVLHFDLVRSDLSITVGSQAVDSAEVGNGYVNFKPLSDGTWYVNGSLPAQETEAALVQATLRPKQSIKISAVVDQIAFESPRLLWVHFEAEDEGPALAQYISSALAKMGSPQLNVTAVRVPLTTISGAIFQNAFLGANGTITQLNGNVYVFSVPRNDYNLYTLGNIPASASLGVEYTFYVQPLTTGNNIIINTDLALKGAEIEPVRDALAAAGLNVTGLHDDFITTRDDRRLFFENAFAVGDAGVIGDALYASFSRIFNYVD